jgi:cysteine synthase B
MNILNAIGNTPLIELKNIKPFNSKIRIFGKVEANNPGGSIKDRAALYMIKAAEFAGELNQKMTVIEATSGNTGISLAMICASKGYRVKLFMPECVSSERRSILSAFGAEVVLTSGIKGTDGAISALQETYHQNSRSYYWPNQFTNCNNVLAHFETTGPEILNQTEGKVDIIVAGIGSTGTIVGIGKYIKQEKAEIKIVAVEPFEGHKIQGLKNLKESAVPSIFDRTVIDQIINIDDEDAFKKCRLLAKQEGLLLGMSSGANIAAALKVSENLESGIIAVILPDRGDRYLSTNLFRSYCGECPP